MVKGFGGSLTSARDAFPAVGGLDEPREMIRGVGEIPEGDWNVSVTTTAHFVPRITTM